MFHVFGQSVRSLLMRPAFTILVLLILALCIGGNASIFSTAKAVLFRSLPYQDVDRLVVLNMYYFPNSTDTDLSWPEALDWKRQTKLLDGLSPFLCWQDRLVVRTDSVERIGVNFVPSQYLSLLGVKPQLGRLFSPQEDGPPGSAPFLILSHHLWDRLYSRDPSIVGKKVQLNTSIYTVIGVLPEGFYDFTQGRWEVDAWIPANMAQEAFPAHAAPLYEDRTSRAWFALARLKPGVTLQQAQKEADAFALRMQKAYPDTNTDYGGMVTPLRTFMFEDLHNGMKVLLVGSVLVLLLGCANIANLLLARMAERKRELSLRLALGASQRQLVSHVFVESLILAVLGGALGVLLGIWGTRLLAGMVELPPFTRVELDQGVLAIVTLATLATGFLFGLPPALSVARLDSKGTLQRIAAAGRGHTAQARSGLLVFQIAIVVVLLILAGLFLRSLWLLQAKGDGINTSRLLTVRLNFRSERYEDRRAIAAALDETMRRLEGSAEVEGAAVWGPGTPGVMAQFTDVQREGVAVTAPAARADLHLISPGALELLDIPVLRGRSFNRQDSYDSPRVAIVSQSLADILWPGQDPIGKRLYRPTRNPETLMTVVGMIPNVPLQGRFVDGNHHVIFPSTQSPPSSPILMVRTTFDTESMASALRKVIQQVDSQVPVYDILTMEDRLREEELGYRVHAVIVSVYAALALIMALLGLYGVLAYSVTQRTSEIGVRMALGADRPKILRLIMSRGLLLTGTGLLLGVAAALALTRFLSSLLFGIQERDPVTFAGVILLFAAIAVLATYLPSRRALAVEPTIALRYE